MGSSLAGRYATGGIYAETTGEIARRLATQRQGLASLDAARDIDGGAFAALDLLQPAPVGIYIDQGQAVAQALDVLLAGIGGFWAFGDDGRLFVGRLDAPTAPTAELDTTVLRGLTRRESPPPAWRRRVGYGRVWRVQAEADLAASVPAADRALYREPLRFAEANKTGITRHHRLARDVITEAFFDQEPDAAAEAARLLALHGVSRDLYSARLVSGAFQIQVGQPVRLTWPDWGLAAGRDMIVTGKDGDLSSDAADLELWG